MKWIPTWKYNGVNLKREALKREKRAQNRSYFSVPRVCLKVCAPHFCLKVCALPCDFMVDWLIGWANIAGIFFPFFLKNHLGFHLHFCFIRRMIPMPIGRLELAEIGRLFFREVPICKVRRLWSKNGVRRLWDISSSSSLYSFALYTKGRKKLNKSHADDCTYTLRKKKAVFQVKALNYSISQFIVVFIMHWESGCEYMGGGGGGFSFRPENGWSVRRKEMWLYYSWSSFTPFFHAFFHSQIPVETLRTGESLYEEKYNDGYSARPRWGRRRR